MQEEGKNQYLKRYCDVRAYQATMSTANAMKTDKWDFKKTDKWDFKKTDKWDI